MSDVPPPPGPPGDPRPAATTPEPPDAHEPGCGALFVGFGVGFVGGGIAMISSGGGLRALILPLLALVASIVGARRLRRSGGFWYGVVAGIGCGLIIAAGVCSGMVGIGS